MITKRYRYFEGKSVYCVRGVESPVLANAYLHDALDLWFTKVVRAHCRGEALVCRFADDWVCAFRYQDDAERFYRVLPKRLETFNLQVAPEKTRRLRFSRFHPSMKRQWLNRRGGKRRRYTWEQFTQVLDRVRIARPRITEVKRRRVYA